MAKVYVSEVEKLKAELREKTESFENLKKSHDATVNEITETKLMCDDLRRDLENKEAIIKHISSANDRFREDCDEKVRKWEEEKRALILALEEANEKACFSIPGKKCLEAEKSLKETNEDNRFRKLLEEENRMMEEQLQWKKEQFEHKEEGHEKPQEEIISSEDLELETFTLLDDISSLQMKLRSQTKTSEHLKQALAHEESIRKHLEAQVSENKVRFENVGDTNEASYKELEHKIEKLEQENQELRLEKESFDSSIIELKLQNEELSMMLLVLKQGISEAQAMDKEHNEESKVDRYKEKLDEVYDALDRVCIELDEKTCERYELECELQIFKSACERLKNDLEESHVKRKELEASLLSQVVFGESLKQERRTEELKARATESDKVKFLKIIEEKDKIHNVLQKEIEWLEQEVFKREFESAVAVKSFMERTNEQEKEKFILLMNERKMRMEEIMQIMTSLEEHFSNSLTSFSSELEDDDYGTEPEALLQKLKNENRNLSEKVTRLSSERENLLDFFLGLGDKICEFSSTDTELMDMLTSTVDSLEKEDDDDGFYVSEKMIVHSPTGVNKFEAISI